MHAACSSGRTAATTSKQQEAAAIAAQDNLATKVDSSIGSRTAVVKGFRQEKQQAWVPVAGFTYQR
jgi:hypothetical protein